jgi:hypothetical protein
MPAGPGHQGSRLLSHPRGWVRSQPKDYPKRVYVDTSYEITDESLAHVQALMARPHQLVGGSARCRTVARVGMDTAR